MKQVDPWEMDFAGREAQVFVTVSYLGQGKYLLIVEQIARNHKRCQVDE